MCIYCEARPSYKIEIEREREREGRDREPVYEGATLHGRRYRSHLLAITAILLCRYGRGRRIRRMCVLRCIAGRRILYRCDGVTLRPVAAA
mgnify:CR=1 FL=1